MGMSSPPDPDILVPLAEIPTESEAHILRSILEAAEIPAEVFGGTMRTVFVVAGFTPITISVRRRDHDRGVDMLNELWGVHTGGKRALTRKGLCPVCRYDMAGLDDENICPECGTDLVRLADLRYNARIIPLDTGPNPGTQILATFGLVMLPALVLVALVSIDADKETMSAPFIAKMIAAAILIGVGLHVVKSLWLHGKRPPRAYGKMNAEEADERGKEF